MRYCFCGAKVRKTEMMAGRIYHVCSNGHYNTPDYGKLKKDGGLNEYRRFKKKRV